MAYGLKEQFQDQDERYIQYFLHYIQNSPNTITCILWLHENNVMIVDKHVDKPGFAVDFRLITRLINKGQWTTDNLGAINHVIEQIVELTIGVQC